MINLGNFSSIFVANWKLNGNTEFINEYYQNNKDDFQKFMKGYLDGILT